MATFYHSNTNRRTDLAGKRFVGADRELLSELLGGPVGFACGSLPVGWQGKAHVYEILVPDEALVLVSSDMVDRTLEHNTELVLAKDVKPEHIEVVFLAENAFFGRSVNK